MTLAEAQLHMHGLSNGELRHQPSPSPRLVHHPRTFSTEIVESDRELSDEVCLRTTNNSRMVAASLSRAGNSITDADRDADS
jgi:hypothetical protein